MNASRWHMRPGHTPAPIAERERTAWTRTILRVDIQEGKQEECPVDEPLVRVEPYHTLTAEELEACRLVIDEGMAQFEASERLGRYDSFAHQREEVLRLLCDERLMPEGPWDITSVRQGIGCGGQAKAATSGPTRPRREMRR